MNLKNFVHTPQQSRMNADKIGNRWLLCHNKVQVMDDPASSKCDNFQLYVTLKICLILSILIVS